MLGGLFTISPAYAAEATSTLGGLSPELVGAYFSGAAALLTAAGGILLAFVTRRGKNEEETAQEKIAHLEAQLLDTRQTLDRVRGERDQSNVQIKMLTGQVTILDKQVTESEKSLIRCWQTGIRAIHGARRQLALVTAETKIENPSRFGVDDFPDIEAFKNPDREPDSGQ